MADKTDKFCIAEHGLVGLGYPFQDSVKTNTSLRVCVQATCISIETTQTATLI